MGTRFGRLLVVEYIKGRRSKWRCVCDCGRSSLTSSQALRSGYSKSCGCFKTEKHLVTVSTHRMSRSITYTSWKAMKRRCYNPKEPSFGSYGGRGISVSEEWRNSFETFLSDIGERPSLNHSLERINVNGNYEAENCRWATRREQNLNMRSNVILELNGERKCLSEWAESLCIHPQTLRGRLERGWCDEAILTTPVDARFRHQ